ncbi:MAG: AMP-binding protein [Methanobrevibacter sp.]|jgi:amino acid adenylation domain-containing protein|nr:AMP-binding protein [Methanobrevibacter sp.]
MGLLFSIIIPVYNTSNDYFIRCLNSIKNNHLSKDKLEVIFINDGMSDFNFYKRMINAILKSKGFLTKIISNDINMGQLYSRYIGLKESKGEYVHFVDSDDEIFPHIYTTLVDYLDNDPNFILFMEQIFNNELDLISQEEVFDRIINNINIDELKNKTFTNEHLKDLMHFFQLTLHSKVFNRDWIFKNVELWTPNLRFCEDLLLTIEVLTKAEKFKILPEKLYKYYYLQNKETIITSNMDTNFFFDFLFVFEKSIDLIYKKRWDLRHILIYDILIIYHYIIFTQKEEIEDHYNFFISEILRKYSDINFKFFNKNQYHWFKSNEKLYDFFAPLILSEDEKFFIKMLNISDETKLPSNIQEKRDNEFDMIEFSLNSSIKGSDSLFLASFFLALTKFTYRHEVLISKLYYTDIFDKIIYGMNIDTNETVSTFLSKIKELNEQIDKYKSSFKNFKKMNDLLLPDLQYIYTNNKINNIFEIPNSDFSIIIEDSDEIKVKIIYNISLYSSDLVHLFYNSFILILNKFLNEKNVLLKDISICFTEDKVPEFNISPFKNLNKLFEKVVNENNDKLALIAEDATLTYYELNCKANNLANNLIEMGLEIEDRVIINLGLDSKLIVSIWGVVKAGGTFILTNPHDPVNIVDFIKYDSQARFIISKDNFDFLLENSDNTKPEVNLSADNLVCIVYTSGSTGNPKGVILTHGSILNKIKIEEFDKISDNYKFLFSTNPIFNLFVNNLFLITYKASTIVLANEEQIHNPLKLFELYEKSGFDVITTTPSIIDEYLNNKKLVKLLNKMKIIILGGEILNNELIKNIKEDNNSNLYNLYGLAEDSGHSNIHLVKNHNNSIGKPVLNTLEKIMDIDGNPLPPGVIGELWVGGLGISKGYWKNKKLTREKFVKKGKIRYFKTGDLAKYNNDGHYILLDRIDTQLKLHGQRIDPGEIEKNIPKSLNIKKAVATVKKINNEDILVLYFTTNISHSNINEIKKRLHNIFKSKLPSFMVPRIYVYLNEFPKTISGKTKIRDLPKPKPDDLIIEKMIPPSTKLEKEIFYICSEILGYDNFGINSTLLTIGFTSLSLIKLSTKILEKYGVELSLIDLLKGDADIMDICNQIEEPSKTESFKCSLKEFYPLTPQQLNYFNQIQDDDESYSDFIMYHYFIFKDVDPIKLKKALFKLINFNPDIKTSFKVIDNKIYQQRNDKLRIDISFHNEQLTTDIMSNYIKHFNLFESPLFSFEIYYYGNETSLLFSIHHILFDYSSTYIFLNELFQIYFNENWISNNAKVTYFDYSFNLELKNKDTAKVESYFKSKTKNIPLNSYIKSISQIQEHETKFAFISLIDMDKITSFCQRGKISYDNLFLATAVLTLSDFFNRNHLVLEYIFNGRDSVKYNNTLGLFRRHIPLFFDIEYDCSINDYLYYVNRNINDGINMPSSNLSEKFKSFINNLDPPNIIYDYISSLDNSVESMIKDKIVESGLFNDSNLFNKKGFFVRVIIDKSFEIVLIYDSAYFSNKDINDFLTLLLSYLQLIINNPLESLDKIMKK